MRNMGDRHSAPSTQHSALGVVLAGGRSRRMGADKALLRARAGGPALIEVVVGRLREAGLGSVLVVTNSPEEYAFLGLPAVADEVPGAGPLGGILTGLVYSPFERVFVVGCDMPLLRPALIKYL